MQTTTGKTRLPSSLTTAKTQIKGSRPITKQTQKGIDAQLDLQARGRKIITLHEGLKALKIKQTEYKNCKEEFISDLLRTNQDTFLVHGKKYYLKLVETKNYKYSIECEVLQNQIDDLKIDLEKLKTKEKLFGIAKHDDSSYSLCPKVNMEAI
tara:strand:- start:1275 stop:1733 length:459 start_codon:yes stop_codon:yes gene_type:complete